MNDNVNTNLQPTIAKHTHYVSLHNHAIYPAMSQPAGYEDEHPSEYRPANANEVSKYNAGAELAVAQTHDISKTTQGENAGALATPRTLQLGEDENGTGAALVGRTPGGATLPADGFLHAVDASPTSSGSSLGTLHGQGVPQLPPQPGAFAIDQTVANPIAQAQAGQIPLTNQPEPNAAGVAVDANGQAIDRTQPPSNEELQRRREAEQTQLDADARLEADRQRLEADKHTSVAPATSAPAAAPAFNAPPAPPRQ